MATTPIDVFYVSDKTFAPLEMLGQWRLRSVTTATAEAAIERLHSIDFDVILADIDLPSEAQTKLFRLIALQQPEALAVRANFVQTDALYQTAAGLAQQVADSRQTVYHFVDNPWNT